VKQYFSKSALACSLHINEFIDFASSSKPGYAYDPIPPPTGFLSEETS
jgi:hypothetical protein